MGLLRTRFTRSQRKPCPTPMSLTLAHFSDVHLGPVPLGDVLGDFRLKRLIGGASWHFRRKALHLNANADLLRADVLAAKVNHICFTGDLVNIAAQAEFARAAKWLAQCGSPADVSMVPGNHDAYVSAPFGTGLGLFRSYMQGDGQAGEEPFPYVRLRRNIAIIGLSSAQPQSLRKAVGTLGKVQLNTLAARLSDLGTRGFYRVVMIHHPPLPSQAPPRKSLTDAEELAAVIEAEGAELVLHGHNHRSMIAQLKGKAGITHVVGVPSASMVDLPGHTSAQWHAYSVSRARGQWQTRMLVRRLDGAAGRFVDGRSGILGEDL